MFYKFQIALARSLTDLSGATVEVEAGRSHATAGAAPGRSMRSKSKASSVQSTATRVSAGAAKKYSSDEERDLKVNINCLVL